MMNLKQLLLILVASLAVSPLATADEAKVPKGFTPIFNGKDLTGWKGLVANPKARASM